MRSDADQCWFEFLFLISIQLCSCMLSSLAILFYFFNAIQESEAACNPIGSLPFYNSKLTDLVPSSEQGCL